VLLDSGLDRHFTHGKHVVDRWVVGHEADFELRRLTLRGSIGEPTHNDCAKARPEIKLRWDDGNGGIYPKMLAQSSRLVAVAPLGTKWHPGRLALMTLVFVGFGALVAAALLSGFFDSIS
jgi:hypothetical protein